MLVSVTLALVTPWNVDEWSLSSAQSARPTALDAVERAVDTVLAGVQGVALGEVSPWERESIAVARRLRARLDSFATAGDCRRCWLQRAHCVCVDCPTIAWREPAPLRRIFVLMSHKEVVLAVDTAKLVCAAYSNRAVLVVGGLGCQPLWDEMVASLTAGTAAILYPSDDAWEIDDVFHGEDAPRDLVVIDGTWSQAAALHRRLPPSAPRVRLPADTLADIATNGRQLRHHPEMWREISTLTAVSAVAAKLDLHPDRPDALLRYQAIADAAARRQLGPVRISEKRRARAAQ
ncbi:hypothetical protein CTAYLR_004896 [Chrysophaeum taylorii]|uniref:tRNA-uridine aminocarboxypropyltransferase n=1 Tax=Chrysophaeum taylorii TaxID=2483200 RepID=A0AAD7UNK7_9STRA|nr:hypothetical protein CTAYLR_004896 [Chrysophaeum taylorii]